LLAQVFRHLEGVADGPPDHLGIQPVREGTLDGAPAELIEHEVLGHALRVHLAELRPHQVPEFRQPHAAQGTAGPGPDPLGGKQRWPTAPGLAAGAVLPDVSLSDTWEIVGAGAHFAIFGRAPSDQKAGVAGPDRGGQCA